MGRDFGSRRPFLSLVLIALLSVPFAGCAAVKTAMIVIKGTDIKAEYDGLEQMRVAVVCRPRNSFEYHTASAARSLARDVARLLRANVKKIDVVSQREVDKWTDEHVWDEYGELGEALNADMVVGIDLDQFSLNQGTTLLQGQCQLQVAVYDVIDGGTIVYEPNLSNLSYPKNAIPATDLGEAEFRQKFVRVIAGHIARHFYDHDAYESFAEDSTVLH